MHPTHVPLRLATGAYVLNSGINKLRSADEEAEQAHAWTSSVYPIFSDMKPRDFNKLLAYGEIGLGAALLLPKVPSLIAGSALAAFGAGLTGLYLKTPGMTKSDGIRPTAEGTSLAKDVWLVGAGLTLALQSFASGTKNAAAAVGDAVSDAVGAGKSAVNRQTSKVTTKVDKGKSAFLSGAHDAREELSGAMAEFADVLLKP